MRSWPAALVHLCVLCAAPGFAAPAVPIDGVLDAAYGAPLSTQAVQTDEGDNAIGEVARSGGSELDEAYAFVFGGTLHLFVAGNLLNLSSPSRLDLDYLNVFIDSKPGGQSPLRGDNSSWSYCPGGVNLLAGLTFDTGFAPDYWLGCAVDHQARPFWAYWSSLPAGAGGTGSRLGNGLPGGPGTLSGGSNPYGILATIDNRNTAGVTAGCDVAWGAGVTTGFECAVPLAAIGDPGGCIRICVFASPACRAPHLRNQVLGPLPPGCVNLFVGDVNFSTMPGDQYFTVCLQATPARVPSWGGLKSIYR